MLVILVLVFLLLTPAAKQPNIEFQDTTRDAGLLEPIQGMMGHAAAWGDFDNDGRPDLFVGGFCDRPDSEYLPAKGPVPTRLFRNLGNGKFEMIKNSPVEFCGRTSGAVFVDLNHDGFPELYVANNSKGPAKQMAAQRMLSK
ncbi:MAG: FG-GAP repeat domain-containing protein, partial [Terriglobia bacterium]